MMNCDELGNLSPLLTYFPSFLNLASYRWWWYFNLDFFADTNLKVLSSIFVQVRNFTSVCKTHRLDVISAVEHI